MKLLATTKLPVAGGRLFARQAANRKRLVSSHSKSEHEKEVPVEAITKKEETTETLPKTHKSMADMDEEMKQAMEKLSGEGGEYGLELEGGKPVAMKRGVKENMFRYI